jgi:Putative GTPase activating protein for Arf/Ankyrin repeats (many copies)
LHIHSCQTFSYRVSLHPQAKSASGNLVNSSSSSKGGFKVVSSASQIVAVQQQRRKEMASLITGILRSNVSCAECGKDSPDWISINLGCLICIDCSGVHRSLGVHISKVRSLSLDDLDAEEYALVIRVGNKIINSIWENSIPDDVLKPKPSDPYIARDKFIRAKYQDKSFISRKEALDTDVLNFKLQLSCMNDDVVEASKSLALGASPNTIAGSDFMLYTQATEDKTGEHARFNGTESALHIAVKSGSLGCCVLLVLNGADAKVVDRDGKSPIDIGQQLGFDAIVAYLNRKADASVRAPAGREKSDESSPTSSVAALSSAGNPSSGSTTTTTKELDPELMRRILF